MIFFCFGSATDQVVASKLEKLELGVKRKAAVGCRKGRAGDERRGQGRRGRHGEARQHRFVVLCDASRKKTPNKKKSSFQATWCFKMS
jgi:hypothetical protein